MAAPTTAWWATVGTCRGGADLQVRVLVDVADRTHQVSSGFRITALGDGGGAGGAGWALPPLKQTKIASGKCVSA